MLYVSEELFTKTVGLSSVEWYNRIEGHRLDNGIDNITFTWAGIGI